VPPRRPRARRDDRGLAASILQCRKASNLRPSTADPCGERSGGHSMKRLVIATVVLLGSALSAYAHHPDATYHEMIRPNGHARSDAVFYSAVTACKRISHNSIYA